MSNRQLTILGLVALGLLVVSNSFFTVDQRERSALFQLGEIVATDHAPGLHMKWPFFQKVSKFEKRVLTLDSQPESFLTSEKKNVRVDYFAKWRIADTVLYYRSTGGDETVATDRLSSILNRGLRNEFGVRTIQQAVSDERDVIIEALAESVRERVAELGIGMVDVRIKRIDLPDEVRESVYQRMRAERTRVASDLRARGAEEAERIRSDADRQAVVIVAEAYREAEQTRGEGDARAAEIYAGAYGRDPDFYRFTRSLRAYREAMRSGQDILVLEPDSEFFRFFKSSGGSR
jgi:modulator of FtsH protease HflC